MLTPPNSSEEFADMFLPLWEGGRGASSLFTDLRL